MGMDLSLFMADWERLGRLAVDDRARALEDAVWPPERDDAYDRYPVAGGWIWPPEREGAWCAEYDFACTTGAYSPHFRAGDAWDDVRGFVDAALREAMDTFLGGLIWDEDPDADPALTGGGGFFPPAGDGGRPRVLLVCPPGSVSGKARAWERAEPRLDELREPFAAECAGWAGRPGSFEDFTTLLREWGAVTAEAAYRGWGLVGLP
ncbi:hypothetical protein [Streptomyces sp. NPDC101132]|uniref:hypothetical protein n=1 Tax=Streptomyces sp. NPDC101132 TaxID=3366110 RepID=UPI0038146B39